ncbi:MAG: vitamin K epoxide reductase family protein [Gemmatimonadaceae bacterium]
MLVSKRQLIALVALLGVFVASYLTLYKVGAIGELVCRTGSCETVQLSRWATFLGLPVAAWGIVFYVVLLAVALAGLQERFADSRAMSLALLAWTGWGVLFSAWLTYLELFVINAICQWCVVSAILVAIAFVISVLDWRARLGTFPTAVGGATRAGS